MTTQDQDSELQNLMHEVEKELHEGHFQEAEQKLQQIRTQSKEGVLNIAATTYLAQMWARQHKYIEAYQALAPIANKLEGPSVSLMQQVAWKTGDLKTALKFGDEAYQVESTYQTALINAFCYSLSGQVTPAIGWLQRAINDGLPNVPQILQRKEFDPIRDDPSFKDVIEG